jgi:glycerophosphoryl diester phosphodiesterase
MHTGKLMIAHRGYHSAHPENTLAAFRSALLEGADMVEFDVRKLADGTLVVRHDPDIGDRPLSEMTLRGLRDAANRASLDIPTLGQVLSFCAGRLRVDVELKEPGCEKEVLEAIFEARFRAADFMITAFDASIVDNVRQESRGVRTGLIVTGQPLGHVISEAERLGADYLVPDIAMLDPGSLRAERTSHLPLLPWTVNGREDLKRMLKENSVAGIITDEIRDGLELRRSVG